MAYGYRDNGASLIVGLVQDYRDRAERKSNREQEIAYRNERDAENDRRWSLSEKRATDDHKMRVEAFNDTKDRLAAKQLAKKGYVASLERDAWSGYEKTATEYATTLNTIMMEAAKGSSGTGGGFSLAPDKDGNVRVGIETPEGVKPLTAVPSDNNSAPMVISKENIAAVGAHVEQTASTYAKMGGDPALTQAYIRASLHTDPETGDTTPASPEQMAANIKSQGFYKPKETSVKGAKLPTFEWDKDGIGTKNILKNTIKEVATNTLTDSARGFGVDRAINLVSQKADKVLSDYFDSEHWNGKGNGKDKFKVSEKGVTVKPSKVDLQNPKNVEEIITVKGELAENNVQTTPTEEQVKFAQLKFEEQMQALNEKYKARKIRDAAVSDLYLADVIDQKQFDNYAETGDMRYSRADLLGEQRASDKFNLDARNTISSIQKREAEIAKLNGYTTPQEKQKAVSRIRNEMVNSIKDRAKTISESVHGGDSGSPARVKQSTAVLEKMVATTVVAMNFSPEQMASAEVEVTMMHAMESYLRDNGDMKGSSFTPYMNTALNTGRRQTAAQSIMKVHKAKPKNSTVTEKELLDRINSKFDATRKAWGGSDVPEDLFNKVLAEFETEELARFKG